MTSSSNISGDNRQGSRLRKVNTRYFSFKWKTDTNESTSIKNDDNLNTMDHLNDCKKSTGFFRNITKNLSVKNFYKFKRRITNGETSKVNDDDDDDGEEDDNGTEITRNDDNDNKNISEVDERIGASNVPVVRGNQANNLLVQVASNDGPSEETSTSQTTTTTTDNNERSTSQVVNRSVGLSQELLKLHKFGWYWGGIQRDFTEERLKTEPDGSFLIRDSENHR